MRLLLLLAFAAGSAARSPAARAEPSLSALRVGDGEIRLDGRLDEPAWSRAAPARGFLQREPREGQPASEDTEVRVLYDGSSLYVGVNARDREPQRVIARILQRDKLMQVRGDQSHDFAGDDAVAILLDTFRDRRNAVVFATNANGAQFDALITDEGESFNADWHGVWTVRAQRTPSGWSAEFGIPFRTLRYPENSGPASWGFNVYRVIRRRNEQTFWTAWSRAGGGFNRVSQAGALVGLSGLPRGGLNLDLKPFGLSGVSQDRVEDPSFTADRQLAAGVDAKWELQPGLVLDATLNPDFAQVEADDEQVNLTRFDLFFPEKRDFFLENAGIFEFGARGFFEPPPFLLFFSRRVGLAEDEDEESREVPVVGGLRLSGRAGRQTLGVLDMVTGPALGEGHVNYGVFRVKRDIGGNSYLGAMLTDRRGSGASESAAGIDASFWPSRTLNFQGFYARLMTSGGSGDDSAYRVGMDYSAERLGVLAAHLGVGPAADPALGFATRSDIRRSDVFARITLRPGVLGLRKADFYPGGQYVTRTDGELQDWNVGPFVSFEWDSGERLSLFHSRTFTRIDEAFDPADRVSVPPGDYDGTQRGFFGRTSANRALVLSAEATLQRNYGGTVDSYGGGASLTPGSHLALGLRYNRNNAELPGGSFAGDLASLRLGWTFSTRLNASAFVQYNGLDRKLVTNLRLNFIHRPGSDLFVVYNEERDSESGKRLVVSRALVVKLTWLARF